MSWRLRGSLSYLCRVESMIMHIGVLEIVRASSCRFRRHVLEDFGGTKSDRHKQGDLDDELRHVSYGLEKEKPRVPPYRRHDDVGRYVDIAARAHAVVSKNCLLICSPRHICFRPKFCLPLPSKSSRQLTLKLKGQL